MKSFFTIMTASLAVSANAHVVLTKPMSRNFLASQSETYPRESCPQCLNDGGAGSVQLEQMERLGLERWQGYPETAAVAARHSVCGSTGGDGKLDYSDSGKFAPLSPSYVGSNAGSWGHASPFMEGGEISFDVSVTAHHLGHFEFYLCNKDDLEPGADTSSECLNMHRLQRAVDADGEVSPTDPNHPERYYLPPSCALAVNGPAPDGSPQVLNMRYMLPDGLSCDHCVLQLVYVTSNTCNPDGYQERENWPQMLQTCDDGGGKWWSETLPNCRDGGGYPEEFWNCADIQIVSSASSQVEIDSDVFVVVGLTTAPAQMAGTALPVSFRFFDAVDNLLFLADFGPLPGGDHTHYEEYFPFAVTKGSEEESILRGGMEVAFGELCVHGEDNVLYGNSDALVVMKDETYAWVDEVRYTSGCDSVKLRVQPGECKRFPMLPEALDAETAAPTSYPTIDDATSTPAPPTTVPPTTAPTAGNPSPSPPSTPSPTMGTNLPSNSQCSGSPCQDPNLCRSQWGYCGYTSAHCNDASTWLPSCVGGGPQPTPQPAPTANPDSQPPTRPPTRPPTQPPTQPPTRPPTQPPTQPPTSPPPTYNPTSNGPDLPTSAQCAGEPCENPNFCRSKWGYCGDTSAYCNAENTWMPSCAGSVPQPTPQPSPTTSPPAPSQPAPTASPQPSAPPSPTAPTPAPDMSIRGQMVRNSLNRHAEAFTNSILLYQTPSMQWEPSNVYKFEDMVVALEKMWTTGIGGLRLYMGNDVDVPDEQARKYAIVNIAAFLAQSMHETIQYNACDENSWDLVSGRYPVSNSCGQLGQSYQDYQCPAGEEHMACEVDPNMELTATTNAKWYGAPAPLFCGPKSKYPETGSWDYSYECNKPWADPPELCSEYEGQKAGGFDNSEPWPNSAGRTDVEGCCYWGRGVIQTTGVCNFGKLNFFLGARANNEGREAMYPDIDFCRRPDMICDANSGHPELKWIAGLFYWMESVQRYDEGGWNYLENLRQFVDSGMPNPGSDSGFIHAVSGIVNRGCHNPPCGTGSLHEGSKRAQNFKKVLDAVEGYL